VDGRAAAGLALEASRPNPVEKDAVVTFSVARAGRAELVLYDLVGRKVRTPWSGDVAAGSRAVYWSGADDVGREAPAGLYYVRLRTDEGALKRTLVKLR
jgi:flagellar hook assembly protein FlgD